jgi:hypothetical protein
VRLLAPAGGSEVAACERLALDAPQDDCASQGQSVVDGGGAEVGRGGLDQAEVGVSDELARHISNFQMTLGEGGGGVGVMRRSLRAKGAGASPGTSRLQAADHR